MVSKRHATLACSATGQMAIKDEGSSGGTILNSCVIDRGPGTLYTPLRDGTIIQFGLMQNHPELGILRAPKFVVVLSPTMFEHYMDFLHQTLPDTNVALSPMPTPSTSTVFYHRMDLPRDQLPQPFPSTVPPTLSTPNHEDSPASTPSIPVPAGTQADSISWISPCAGRNLFRAGVLQAVKLDAVQESSDDLGMWVARSQPPLANNALRHRWRQVLGAFNRYTLVSDDLPPSTLLHTTLTETERWNVLR